MGRIVCWITKGLAIVMCEDNSLAEFENRRKELSPSALQNLVNLVLKLPNWLTSGQNQVTCFAVQLNVNDLC